MKSKKNRLTSSEKSEKMLFAFLFIIMRKFIALTALLFVLLPTATLAFDDIDNSAVKRLVENNVITDGKHFLPQVPCTRAQYVTWLLKNVEEDVSGQRIREPFIDVDSSDDFGAFVGRAWQLGVIDTGANFRPGDAITRIEALKIALKLEGMAIPKAGFTLSGFADAPKTAEEQGVLHKALELRIIKPVDEKIFGTNLSMNRLECAQLIDAVSLSRRSEQHINVEIGGGTNEENSTFDNVLHTLENKYLYADKLDSEALVENAIKGMVDSLGDPHTVFFTQEEVANFLTSVGIETQYGIGSQVGLDKEGRAMIIKPLKGSPAEKANLLPGDVIMKVDGIDVSQGDKPLEEVVGLIKGEDGTTVKIEYLRNGKIFPAEIVRAPIHIESVATRVQDGYLVVEIDFFGNDTVDKIREAMEGNIVAAKKGIVFDLRNNPGGFLDTAVDLLALFLPQDAIAVKTRGAAFTHTDDIDSSGGQTEIPLVVLVNELSASASEIVAGAIQDNKRGVVIGTQTFGKGTAQELLQFNDGTALKVTIAEWLTPNDRSIDGVGITPDYVVADIDNDETIFEYAFRIIQRGQWRP